MRSLKHKKIKQQPRERDIFDIWVYGLEERYGNIDTDDILNKWTNGLEERYGNINPEFLKRYGNC